MKTTRAEYLVLIQVFNIEHGDQLSTSLYLLYFDGGLRVFLVAGGSLSEAIVNVQISLSRVGPSPSLIGPPSSVPQVEA